LPICDCQLPIVTAVGVEVSRSKRLKVERSGS
jgi:hypothetical protein